MKCKDKWYLQFKIKIKNNGTYVFNYRNCEF